MMRAEPIQHVVSAAKGTAISGSVAMGGGMWAWLGDNHTQIGAICAVVGAVCAIIGMAVTWHRSRK